MKNKKVVCIGEILWDSLPKGMYLGGAPFNVAVNLNNLGIDVSIISAVGNDTLGKRTIDSVKQKGIDTSNIQINEYETGLVEVAVNEHGIPSYNIHQPVAWDFIKATNEAKKVVAESDYAVIGSLAFRNKESANSISDLLKGYNGICVVDVNFRQPFYSEELIDKLLTTANIVKVNDEELQGIAVWKKIDGGYQDMLKWLVETYNLQVVLLSRGDQGSTIYKDGEFTNKTRYTVRVKDTVGAGDAFLAGSIFSLINEESAYDTICFANAIGAFVASRNGAAPNLDMNKINIYLEYEK